MNKEDKELLLRDLCGRLPYGVKVRYSSYKEFITCTLQSINPVYNIIDLWSKNACFNSVGISKIKPYLFPLSSMTEEQYDSLHELGILDNCSHSYEYVNPHIHGVSFIFKEFKTYSLELIEWLNKNHFDYRGLIEKGLAINATGLNIY